MKALLVGDIQNGLTKRMNLCNNSVFFDSVNQAIQIFRETDNIIIFIQHNNKQLLYSTNDWEFDSRIEKRNNDIIIQKFHGDAFIKTDLESILYRNEVKEIIVCGLVSHGCVKSTCLGGFKSGLKTNVLAAGHTSLNKDALLKIWNTESDLSKIGIQKVDINELYNHIRRSINLKLEK